jgi:hypothetical protein
LLKPLIDAPPTANIAVLKISGVGEHLSTTNSNHVVVMVTTAVGGLRVA